MYHERDDRERGDRVRADRCRQCQQHGTENQHAEHDEQHLPQNGHPDLPQRATDT